MFPAEPKQYRGAAQMFVTVPHLNGSGQLLIKMSVTLVSRL